MSTLPLFADAPRVTPTELRAYQAAALETLRALRGEEARRVLFVGPCGMGKMVCIASIVRTARVPVLFVCDSMEILEQCAAQLAKVGIARIGVIRGDDARTDPSATIQLATIQSLQRRNKPFRGQKILILIDEAHLSASPQWKTHVFDAYPDAHIIGFTATPTRLDGKPLGALYNTLVEVVRYSALLRHPEWLVAPDIYGAPIAADLSGVHTVHGDYHEGELGEAMSATRLIGQVVAHWRDLAHLHPRFEMRQALGKKTGVLTRVRVGGKMDPVERRRTILFAVNVKHSLALCEEFAKELPGVRVAHLDGTTPERTRRALLADLAAGRLDILSNVGVMTKGLDIPSVKCVIHARPTQSLVLWMQSTGRCLRPWNNVVPLLLDHAQNFERHGAPHEDRVWSLTAKARRMNDASMKKCARCHCYNASGAGACIACGYPFPFVMKSSAVPSQTDAALEMKIVEGGAKPFVLDGAAKEEVLRKNVFDGALSKARSMGFKPGWVSFHYKKIFHEWPPGPWSDEVRASFAGDVYWQALVAKRETRKRELDAQDAAIRRQHEEAFEAEQARRAYRMPTHEELVRARAVLEAHPDDVIDAVNAFQRTLEADAGPPQPTVELDPDESFGDWLATHDIG